MTTNDTPERDRLIVEALRAFTAREVDRPTVQQLSIALDAYEATLTRCTCPDCTQGRQERTGLTDHDRIALARVLHGIVYSPGASYDRAVPGIQEYMLACADKVAAALPWVVPTPEVTLEVGEGHMPIASEDEAELIKTANTFRAQVDGQVTRGSLVDLWLRSAAALEARVTVGA